MKEELLYMFFVYIVVQTFDVFLCIFCMFHMFQFCFKFTLKLQVGFDQKERLCQPNKPESKPNRAVLSWAETSQTANTKPNQWKQNFIACLASVFVVEHMFVGYCRCGFFIDLIFIATFYIQSRLLEYKIPFHRCKLAKFT